MSRYLRRQGWERKGGRRVPEVQHRVAPCASLSSDWTHWAGALTATLSAPAVRCWGFLQLVLAAHDWDISRWGLATCAPVWCEVWHSGGFKVAFLSDTPSTRRYGSPCVIGKYMSLYLYFRIDSSFPPMCLWCVSSQEENQFQYFEHPICWNPDWRFPGSYEQQ